LSEAVRRAGARRITRAGPKAPWRGSDGSGRLEPVRALLVSVLPGLLAAGPAGPQDVPLREWTRADWPEGLPLGAANGISWGDLDADGWVDLFVARSGRVWRNLAGRSWQPLTPLYDLAWRYGAALGDYDADGWLDAATEPRGTQPMMLLRGPSLEDVAGDPDVVDVRPRGQAETSCWGDVDHDGDLDLFVPVYPEWEGSAGNFFLHDLGPSGPRGAYRFHEASGEVGLDNVLGSGRPEGAQLCDVDRDGDLDLYAGSVLYQNRSRFDAPRFEALREGVSGLPFTDEVDEGCAFFDHDLDGDLDFVAAYCGPTGVRVFENRGDGTFARAPLERVEEPFQGLCLGLSFADWDNDGDLDLTTRGVFRRNARVETGRPSFVVARHGIPEAHRFNATPAWADWDRDGDLDCALGNWAERGRLYENVTYGSETTRDERRFVRVRVAGDSVSAPRGIEDRFGAEVELFVDGDPPGLRRRQEVSSSSGYLNQNEYALHFALPRDPAPDDPARDLAFDVAVDFPSDPDLGLVRVDRWVNPALGRVVLAELVGREITVFPSGRVIRDGVARDALPGADPRLHTTGGGLALATNEQPLGELSAAPGADHYVGIEFDTRLASGPLLVREIVLDGVLDPEPAACDGRPIVLALWDVTDGGVRRVQADHGARAPRNARSTYRFEARLLPGRRYRAVARVEGLRETRIVGPLERGGVTLHGGLSFTDLDPCSGVAVRAAALDGERVSLALRYARVP